MRTVLLMPVLFALVACGSQDDGGEIEPQAEQTAMPVEPDGGIGDGAPPLSQMSESEGIPARFHGVWDYEEGSCNPASDLRAEVTSGEIIFYESVGEVRSVSDGEGGAVVSLAMSGEGDTWNTDLRLTLRENPERLVISRAESAEVAPTDIRKRCAS